MIFRCRLHRLWLVSNNFQPTSLRKTASTVMGICGLVSARLRFTREDSGRNPNPRRESMKNFLAVAIFLAAAICGTAVAQSTSPSSSDLGTSQTQPTANTQNAQQPQPATPGQSMPTQPVPAQSTAAAGPAAQGAKIAPGSVIPVELTKTVDAKKAKTGDEVVA